MAVVHRALNRIVSGHAAHDRGSAGKAFVGRSGVHLRGNTGNLDPANAVMIGDLLFSMVEKYKKTLLLVTHDMKLAEKGDVCYKIVDGKLQEAR